MAIILQVLRYLLIPVEVLVGAPILYLCIVSCSAIFTARRRKKACAALPSPAQTRFAILVPAHNEELMLGGMLNSLAELTYPRERFAVHVVADNCTDRTAEIVRETGWITVHERFDTVKRGKGYALNWLLQTLEDSGLSYDAYVTLDADTLVDPGFLHALEKSYLAGAQAMQTRCIVLNASESASTALRWLALTLINYVRPLGRDGLGGSSTLANGLCLSRALLQLHPWQAFSVTEDYQYYLHLVEHGERVRYVPDALSKTHMPTTFSQMRTQDIRWEGSGGGAEEESKWRLAWKLLRDGLRYRSFVRLEAVAELLTPTLSLLVASCLLTFIAALIIGPLPAQVAALACVIGLLFYISSALILARPPRTIYRALLHAPAFMLWKLWIVLVLKRRKNHSREWVRTSRTAASK